MKKLYRKFVNLFLNDWIDIKVYRGRWDITGQFADYNKFCVYSIQYSKYEDRYRLKCSGFKAKEHKLYPLVKDVLYRIIYNQQK